MVWNTASSLALHNKNVLPVKGSASLISDVLTGHVDVPDVVAGCKGQDQDFSRSDKHILMCTVMAFH